jgi:hypothetical protein
MSTYEQLRGARLKFLDQDPANASGGQVWYNSTTGKDRVQGIGVGAWSSGGLLNTGRLLGGAFGTQTAAVYSVGQNPTPLTSSNATEEYNGVGWSNGTNYPTSLGGTGGTAGTQTNGLFAGGPPGLTASNLYDGSTWTATGSLNRGGDNIGNCGTGTTSDVIFCIGRTPATGNSGNNQSETFDGSTFTTAPNYNTSRMLGVGMGSGTATAGLIFGGFIDPSPGPTGLTACEEYNGTSWTTVNGLNRSDGLSTGWGTQTNTVKSTGQPSYILAEQYDGSTWTNISDMSTGGPYANSAGSTGNAGMVTGLGPTKAQTEEYNFSTTTVTPAAWSSGGSLGTARTSLSGGSGAGIKTAAVVWCGQVGPGPGAPGVTSNVEEYDGSSWSEVNNYPGARQWVMGLGTQTAALGFGGQTGTNPSPDVNESNHYDGTSWTAGGTMNDTGRVKSGFGIQTAAISAGGSPRPGIGNSTESYDGTTWTNLPNMNTTAEGRGSAAGSPQTAGLLFGGSAPSNELQVEEWNGSTWTEVNNLNNARRYTSGFGTQASCVANPGEPPSSLTTTESWDGTNWSTFVTTSNPAPSRGNAAAAPSSAGLIFGGSSAAPGSTNTEEFTAESTTANPAQSLTTSS